LSSERRYYCSMCLDGFQFIGIEVRRGIQLLDLRIQSRECRAQFLRRRLATYRDWPCVIQRVIVDGHPLPQSAVHQTLLKARPRIVEKIREHIRRVRRFGILADTRSLPLQQHGHGVDRSLRYDGIARREWWNVGNGIGDERIRAACPSTKLARCYREDAVRVHVSGDYQYRVVRDVVLVLDEPHLLRRGRRHNLTIAYHILP